ncbi:hypothetical protein [Pseudonocardia sp. GCM10023141]|uniref:hypothetical protein n=1 Tax=Pseudonocardia sp. GCM10023141 TaxID=3252653 RepID=UPI003614634E
MTDHTDGSPPLLPYPARDDVPESDGVVTLTLLTVDGALLAAFGLVFTPLYWNAIPVPVGAVLSLLIMPWLVRRAGLLDSRPSMAGAPLWAWLVIVAVLGFVGPGGDAMISTTWQSLLLIMGTLATGLWALRGVLLTEYGRPRG